MTPSFVRYTRGFLCGSLIGAGLLTFGLVSWVIAFAVGADKEGSTHGISLLPIYVLAFGLAGGVVNTFKANRAKNLVSVLAWMLAVAIVLSGCFLMASFVVSREPVDWSWGVGSGGLLFVMVTGALAIRASNNPAKAVTNAPADGGRDSGS